MPVAARRSCLTARCPNIPGPSGRCNKCHTDNQQANQQRRGTAHQRGYTRNWGRYRALFLNSYPLCGQGPAFPFDSGSPHHGCLRLGRVVPGNQVDHIKPVSQGAGFWGETNDAGFCLGHQALCESCHASKTLGEERRAS